MFLPKRSIDIGITHVAGRTFLVWPIAYCTEDQGSGQEEFSLFLSQMS